MSEGNEGEVKSAEFESPAESAVVEHEATIELKPMSEVAAATEASGKRTSVKSTAALGGKTGSKSSRKSILNGTIETAEQKDLTTLNRMRRQTQLGLPIPDGNEPDWRWKLCVILDTAFVQTLTMFILFLALFIGDVTVLCTSTNSADVMVSSVLVVVLVFFTCDMFLQCIARKDYNNSFFFYMDLLGTFSLVTEIMWISEAIGLDELEEGTLLRASRTSRVGARAARMTKLVRLLRVLRMTRIMKLLRLFLNNKKENAEKETKDATSLIAVRLSESISKQVAALTMIAILFTPLLSFSSEESVAGAYANLFSDYVGEDCTTTIEPLAESMNDYMADSYQQPVSLIVGTCEITFDKTEPSRDKDKRTFKADDVELLVDVSTQNDEIAGLNIGLNLFVVFLLTFFSLLQNSTCHRLLVTPLEHMFVRLQGIASDLFKAVDVPVEATEDGAGTEEIGTMENIVDKLARLVMNVTSNEGSHKVDAILNDDSLSQEAKNYVLDITHKLDHVSAITSIAKPIQSGDVKLRTEIQDSSEFFPEKVDTELLESWNFDVLTLTNEQIFSYILKMFDMLGLISDDLVEARVLRNLLDLLVLNYKENPYHNFKHITDVTHTVYRMISVCFATTPVTELERLAMMTAALAHDLQHPGQNNSYLIYTKDPLATTYNDLSVLENLHVAALFSIFSEHPEANLLRNLDEQSWWEVRRMVVGMILHTDMTKHFEMVSKLDVVLELRGDGDSEVDKNYFSSSDDRQLLVNLLLHASDISNPCKPWPICQKWTECVIQEFFEQGDMEKSRNMTISVNMDRETTNRPLSQVNFIEIIVAPLWGNTARLLPPTNELLENLLYNRKQWGECCEADVLADPNKTEEQKKEETGKIKKRTEAFFKKYGPIVWGESRDSDSEA
ncbi:hypothetical protein CYMTET_48938 [Cymbomonas tetramitiformis]|uniref:Phosphodiesterase n=1 Tax=Cymbomonas tetramitiformis TaxID=36881 RepID=A0AAE0BRB8_9CHLO|nr:hypothetical protein CYMTET_48938 [Cymbomonas tetramitiformis]